MLALGLAAVMSTTVDTVTTQSHRRSEQAFFVADAGISIARRALVAALQEKVDEVRAAGEGSFYRVEASGTLGEFPDVQVLPPLSSSSQFYQDIYTRTRALSALTARDQRFDDINGAGFTVNRVEFTSGSISLTPPSSGEAAEVSTFRYWIQVTGTTDGGGSATVNETGQVTTSIYLRDESDPSAGDRNFSFSGFGAFFDFGDTNANAALTSGTFSGPVHTNTHFAFFSNRNVAFRNVVSQVDNYIRYDSTNFNQGHRSIPNSDITGIDISSEGYQRTGAVPLPSNNFSQEYAVINATGITDLNENGDPVDPPGARATNQSGNLPVFDAQGRVTPETLRENLRNASNNKPTISGGDLVDGVYISSSDGSTINGAGVYVEGNADDIQLYTLNGDQYYLIRQGTGSSATTTIRVSAANNTTTITKGSNSRTYTGIPRDRSDPNSIDPVSGQYPPGVSLFVDGEIRSLRGGVEGSTKRAAIASGTRVTVSAQRDITITGDLKYADAVVNSDGTPVGNVSNITNVMGIFTNDGNVNLAPNTSYTTGGNRSLEMHAAVVSFNSKTSNDGGEIEGSITYTGSNPSSTDRWKLVGSRVQSKINNIGYSNRDVFFDPRFAGGKFRPPFFPGTNYALAEPEPAENPTVVITQADAPWPTGLSWFRDNN
jgi:hypothetical protein